MACNELIVFINQDWVCKTEFLDRLRDLLDLLVAMRTGITLVRLEIVYWDVFDLRFLLCH